MRADKNVNRLPTSFHLFFYPQFLVSVSLTNSEKVNHKTVNVGRDQYIDYCFGASFILKVLYLAQAE